jgi:hypothetical protein
MVNDLTGKMGRAVADAVVLRDPNSCFLGGDPVQARASSCP